MLAKDPNYIIIVDQGSRAAPPIVDSSTTKSLIIDHHLSDEFPENATVKYPLLQKNFHLTKLFRWSLPVIIHLLPLPLS